MNWSSADSSFMARAVDLARRGLYTSMPNPRVGCVLVQDGSVIAEGWHERAGGPHAEIMALQQAGSAASGAECFVSLEPCCHEGRTPPCTAALIKAGVGRVVAAMVDPNPLVAGRGLDALSAAGVRVARGLMQAEASELNRGFVSRMTRGRPFVRCKLAMDSGGRTVVQDGDRWISGEASREDVQRLRAESCAILTGSGTVLRDDPRLNVRMQGAGNRQPARVVLDRRLRTPPSAQMLKLPGRTLIFTLDADPGKGAALTAAGGDVRVLSGGAERFAEEVLRRLVRDESFNEVLVESGATLARSLLDARLVDELVIYQSPDLRHGPAGLPLPGDGSAYQAWDMHLESEGATGRDRRFVFRRVPGKRE